MKTIQILVSPKGENTVTTKGFVGGECRQASKFIEQAAGQRTGEQLTAEFHQVAGLWLQSHEHEDALAEIAQVCRDENWRLAVWDGVVNVWQAADWKEPVSRSRDAGQ